MTGSLWPPRAAGQDREAAATPALLPPVSAGRPGPAPGRPIRIGRLGGRRGGSRLGPGVPGAPGSGGQRHRDPGPPRRRPHGGRWRPPGRHHHLERRAAGHLDRWGRAGGPERDLGPWAGPVTVPVGVAIATIPPSQGLAVRPEWTAQERRRRVRAEAQDRRRAERREDVNGMATIAVLSDAAGKLVERPGMATAGAVLGPRNQRSITVPNGQPNPQLDSRIGRDRFSCPYMA